MFLLTLSLLLWTILLLVVAVIAVAVLSGRMCLTCWNRGYLPIYNKSTQMYDLQLRCLSCIQDEPSEQIWTVWFKRIVECTRRLIG